MQEFEHIQSLWTTHKVEVKISSEEMLSQVKKDVGSIRMRSILNIGGMILSFIAIASLWIFFDFKSWTTHAGLTITITVIAIYTFILYRGHRLIAKNDFTVHPKDFLTSLKSYQLDRFKLYNRLYWIYAVALSVGIVLYFFEMLAYFSFWKQCLAVFLTFGWMLFCSTLVRKTAMRREKERIALLIEKFERISSQFKESN